MVMSRTNEIRQIKWYKKCKYICRLDKIICNNKQKWNKDKCRCDKEYVIKDLFRIQVIVNVSVINLVMLMNI